MARGVRGEGRGVVSHLERPFGVEQAVVRLEVAVDEWWVLRVQVGHAAHQLLRELQPAAPREQQQPRTVARHGRGGGGGGGGGSGMASPQGGGGQGGGTTAKEQRVQRT